jgi:hypothetical protein
MEAKYVQAIKAGIIGGVIIGVLIIVNDDLSALSVLNCCDSIIIIIVMAGIGALGVKMASSLLRTLNDALIVAAVAGAIAGIIGAIVNIIMDIVSSLLTNNSIYSSTLYDSYGYSTSTLSELGALGSICCCGPIILIGAIMLAVIGGAVYGALILKLAFGSGSSAPEKPVDNGRQ